MPLPGGATLATALVADWLAGWDNQRRFHGPALVITAAGDPGLAGAAGLADRGRRAVELSYGVAPDQRGRGYASGAVRLAARWLLDDGHARRVELRIGADNTASRRVAAAAGFTPPGTIRLPVPTTGETGHDLRFVMRHHRDP